MHRCAVYLLVIFLCVGCVSVGPRSVQTQRGDYSEVLAVTDKQELLANIVRVKYMDPPVFLQVASVSASPSLEYGSEMELKFGGPNVSRPLGVAIPNVVYKDAPTILYSPLLGKQFANELLLPFTARQVFQLLDNGFDFSVVAQLMFSSMNGLDNRRSASPEQHADFQQAADLLAMFLNKGLIRIGTAGDGFAESNSEWIMVLDEQVANRVDGQKMLSLLGIAPGVRRLPIGLGAYQDPDKLNIGTRSLLSLLSYLSNYVHVPQAHTQITWPDQSERDTKPPIQIFASEKRPKLGDPGIYYRDHWFYVDATDLNSRNTLYLVRLLFNLQAQASEDSDRLQLFLPVK